MTGAAHRLSSHRCTPHNSYSIVEEIRDVIAKFTAWLEKAGYASYDPYDVWGTRYGLRARQLFYANDSLGLALTGPVILMEIVCPWFRRILVRKQRYATADAQLALAFLNLYEVTGQFDEVRLDGRWRAGQNDEKITDIESAKPSRERASSVWLTKAEVLAADLLRTSIPGYSGYCWGYPFDWQHGGGLTPKGTPLITATPYCYELFVRLADLTNRADYLEIARSIAAFVFSDLKDTPTSNNAAASSYTPHDRSKVVNASAYRAFVLFEAAARFGIQSYADRALGNLRFILDSQRGDSSWLYALDNPKEAFIDHFHTCFVLKNLFKLNRYLVSEQVAEAIRRGYGYYRQALFDNAGNPKSFAIEPRLQLARLEMYNVAEAIMLGALVGADIPEALTMAQAQARRLGQEYQLRDGHFVTRIYFGGVRHTFPFLRWPQAQLFHALTFLLLVSVSKQHGDCREPRRLHPA